MAGSLKPDNIKGKEGTLTLGDNNCNYGSISFLLDEKMSLFWMYDYNQFNEYFTFSIPTTSNIYAYGTEANSSLGASGKSLTLYKLRDGNSYEVVGIFKTKLNSWYKLFSELIPGTYKITANGSTVSFCEWYVEPVETFLIQKNNQFYSFKKDYYDINMQSYLPLESLDFEKGSSLNSFFTEIKIGGDLSSVTPVMTSNTTPSPYIITSNGSYSNDFPPYKAFTGTVVDKYDCWVTPSGVTTGFIMIDMGNQIAVNVLKLTSRNYADPLTFPKALILYGSNNGTDFETLTTITDLVALPITKQNVINLPITYNFRFYKLEIIENNGDINYTSIGNINFSYVSPILAQFKPIDKFDNFQLVCEKSNSLKLNGLKSNRELIVANGDIATDIANSIDYFKLFSSQSDNGSIRIAISIDKGNAWNTIINGKLFLLSCTIPPKPYTLLSEEELVLWSEARDSIYESGITVDLFNTVDFNNLTTEIVIPANMRFAYVINKPTFHDEANISKLEWQFDAKGSMQLMQDSEQQIDIYGRNVKYKSLIDNPLIKVNVML